MHNSNPLASWKLSSMHHYDNTVFLLASSFVMHYSPLRRSFKRGGCKMKAFTFRGLLLTGFATPPLMWIHLDLSVYLNVLYFQIFTNSLDVVACRSKSAFSSLLKNLKQTFFFLFQEGLKESKRSFYKWAHKKLLQKQNFYYLKKKEKYFSCF